MRELVYSFCGAVFGAALFACAFMTAAGGHGSYLSFAVFGAPLSLVHPEFGLFGVLVIWAFAGLLFGMTRRVAWRAAFLLLHVLAVGMILFWGSRFESIPEQWERFEMVRTRGGGSYTTVGFTIYIAGQILAWFLVWRDQRSSSDGKMRHAVQPTR